MLTGKENWKIIAVKHCANKLYNLVEILSKKLEKAGESWVKILPEMFIIKSALVIIVLLAMTTLFVLHIHAFIPITSQFDEWVSSSLIAFAISILIVKFIAISVCLTIFTVKRTTLENIVSRVRDLRKVKLPVIIWRKIHFKSIKLRIK